MAMSSNNPVFGNSPTLKTPSPQQLQQMYDTPQRLTMDDIVHKTALLLGIVVLAGAGAWVLNAGPGLVGAAAIGGFVLALVNIFKRQVSPPLVIAYAALEGLMLGGISKAFEQSSQYRGLPLQAAIGTAAIFAGVLYGYKSGRLRATPRFTKIVLGGFVGMFALLILNALLSWLGVADLGLRGSSNGGSGIAILFSIGFIIFGSLTFVLDFDQADRLIAAGVPERESWRIAFGLVVGLVWLYLEILRLLSYFRD